MINGMRLSVRAPDPCSSTDVQHMELCFRRPLDPCAKLVGTFILHEVGKYVVELILPLEQRENISIDENFET